MSHQLSLIGLEASPHGFATLVFHTDPHQQSLRVRVSPADAQLMAAELAGLPTPRSRLATTLCQIVGCLSGSLAELRLQRGAGNLVEARIVVASALDEVEVPVAFADGVALAAANKLPISGDDSLGSLLQAAELDEEVVLPPVVETFLSSL